MTDPNDWAAPGGADDGPRWGERVAPESAPLPPQAGWTPPAKPGLVPLRPLTFGEILGASFQVFRRNPRTTFGTALLAQVVVAIVTAGAVGAATFAAFDRIESARPSDLETVTSGAIALILLSALVPAALSLVVSSVLQGLFVLETSRQIRGERLRLGGLLALARGRIGALIGWSALVALATIVALAVVAAIVTLGVVIGTGPSIGIGIGAGLLAGLGATALGVWLTVRLCLVPSTLMLERTTLRTAVARSWSLVRGDFWRTFGIVALVFVMIQVAAQVVATPFSILFALLGGTLAPTGDTLDPTSLVVTGIGYLLTILVTSVVTAIGSVVQAASVGLVYVDRRMRLEGLDLELARSMDEHASDPTGLDPFRTPSDAHDHAGASPR
ncbi:glycerophosphoryl diester phosphodiesterase membrane domain-containing protein [Frigoribacterium sp. CFBP 13712]|uniref:glycerophosphoryl diester phosphodiesterase membrane domain-containing protein n=1 Tax=Frigoribacterium sp. CFBP 13712 TaxID=2775309 RepID=UPI0017818714|nr:glycerophosphoryl diester phosphodiesterase membrane domain-containing protein [Frigoribacterium sp. CFBP 13712]MBD8702446.1 glycerophosphoryl diester phosphodiesterase membrane domain-containing protein [Frigoribacterium sp. CFBP 13712]